MQRYNIGTQRDYKEIQKKTYKEQQRGDDQKQNNRYGMSELKYYFDIQRVGGLFRVFARRPNDATARNDVKTGDVLPRPTLFNY